MSVICPTVTAFDLATYKQQLQTAETFAERIHIDLMDGIFAPTKSPPLELIEISKHIPCDIHIMYQYPEAQLDTLIMLKPRMVIVHAEASVKFAHMRLKLARHGIKFGIALLQETTVREARTQIQNCDHCLIFSGHLGYHGGVADEKQLDKVSSIKSINSMTEIGWDGGISKENIATLSDGGIDVLNVGGAIQKQDDPARAYNMLHDILAKTVRE